MARGFKEDKASGFAPQFRNDDGEPSIERFLDSEDYTEDSDLSENAEEEVKKQTAEHRFEWDMHVRRTMRGAGRRNEMKLVPVSSVTGYWISFQKLSELVEFFAPSLFSGKAQHLA